MIFFNLDNLEKECKGDYNKVLKLIYKLAIKKTIISRYTLTGTSYLLNPIPLTQQNNIDILYKIQYLKLASMRDYGLYKLYKYSGLDISFFPDLKVELLNTNPLLKLTTTQLQFLYEDKR